MIDEDWMKTLYIYIHWISPTAQTEELHSDLALLQWCMTVFTVMCVCDSVAVTRRSVSRYLLVSYGAYLSGSTCRQRWKNRTCRSRRKSTCSKSAIIIITTTAAAAATHHCQRRFRFRCTNTRQNKSLFRWGEWWCLMNEKLNLKMQHLSWFAPVSDAEWAELSQVLSPCWNSPVRKTKTSSSSSE